MTPREAAVLPAPLTPPDCDLQDFKFMPLDVARLRDSDMASEQTPEENWAAVLLWAAAWHQVPAGSMPDSDNWIAKAAGYLSRGRIDPHWQDVKAGAMRGFVLCSDGRWYHPVVCEKANESWIAKLHHSWKKECDRIRKANKQRDAEGKPLLPFPPEPTLSSVLIPAEGKRIPPENRRHSTGNDESDDQANGGAATEQPPGAPPSAQYLGDHQHDDPEINASDAVPVENDGIPTEITVSSSGIAGESIGNPLENSLKGQGEGQGQGEYKTHPSGHRASAQPELSAAEPTDPGQLSIAMRRFGISSNPGDLRLIALADQGVSVETVTAACEDARKAKKGEPIPAAYVFSILERWAREAAELNAKGATQPQQVNGHTYTPTEKFNPTAYVNRNRIKP